MKIELTPSGVASRRRDVHSPSPGSAPATPIAAGAAVELDSARALRQEAANFITLIASKFCTPPPTRLVV